MKKKILIEYLDKILKDGPKSFTIDSIHEGFLIVSFMEDKNGPMTNLLKSSSLKNLLSFKAYYLFDVETSHSKQWMHTKIKATLNLCDVSETMLESIGAVNKYQL